MNIDAGQTDSARGRTAIQSPGARPSHFGRRPSSANKRVSNRAMMSHLRAASKDPPAEVKHAVPPHSLNPGSSRPGSAIGRRSQALPPTRALSPVRCVKTRVSREKVVPRHTGNTPNHHTTSKYRLGKTFSPESSAISEASSVGPVVEIEPSSETGPSFQARAFEDVLNDAKLNNESTVFCVTASTRSGRGRNHETSDVRLTITRKPSRSVSRTARGDGSNLVTIANTFEEIIENVSKIPEYDQSEIRWANSLAGDFDVSAFPAQLQQLRTTKTSTTARVKNFIGQERAEREDREEQPSNHIQTPIISDMIPKLQPTTTADAWMGSANLGKNGEDNDTDSATFRNFGGSGDSSEYDFVPDSIGKGNFGLWSTQVAESSIDDAAKANALKRKGSSVNKNSNNLSTSRLSKKYTDTQIEKTDWLGLDKNLNNRSRNRTGNHHAENEICETISKKITEPNALHQTSSIVRRTVGNDMRRKLTENSETQKTELFNFRSSKFDGGRSGTQPMIPRSQTEVAGGHAGVFDQPSFTESITSEPAAMAYSPWLAKGDEFAKRKQAATPLQNRTNAAPLSRVELEAVGPSIDSHGGPRVGNVHKPQICEIEAAKIESAMLSARSRGRSTLSTIKRQPAPRTSVVQPTAAASVTSGQQIQNRSTFASGLSDNIDDRNRGPNSLASAGATIFTSTPTRRSLSTKRIMMHTSPARRLQGSSIAPRKMIDAPDLFRPCKGPERLSAQNVLDHLVARTSITQKPIHVPNSENRQSNVCSPPMLGQKSSVRLHRRDIASIGGFSANR